MHVIGEATASGTSAAAASCADAVSIVLVKDAADADIKEEVLATTAQNSTEELPCADALVVADWVAIADNEMQS